MLQPSAPFDLTSERDALVGDMLASLRDGESLTLIYDHDPKTLLLQIEQRAPQTFTWSQRRIEHGWELTLRKTPPPTTNDPLVQFLDRCPFLAETSAAVKRTLMQVAATRAVPKGKPIVLQGVAWPFLGIVRSGKVFSVVSSAEGREQILYESEAFQTFGEIMLLDGGDSVARFVPLSGPAEILLIRREDILKAMREDEGLRSALTAICAGRARALTELLCAQVSKPVISRIATQLNRYCEGQDATAPVGGSGSAATLSQIAAASGTVKEVVARCLNRLEESGAIRRHRGQIFVVDQERLRSFA